jgi:putative ABC transport system permease protein
MRTLFLAGWRSHRQHPWLGLLSIAGIALGVAIATAIALANAAARRSFAESLDGVVGQATHQVVAGSTGLPETAYPVLRAAAMAHGGYAAPLVEAEVAVVGQPGSSVRLLGVDPFAEGPFRAAAAATQRGSGPTGNALPLARLLTEPGAVVLSSATAAELHLTGNLLTVRYGTRRVNLPIIATLPDNGNALTRANRLVLIDIASAQEALDRVGRLDRIDLILPDAAAEAAVRAVLPPGCELVPAARRGEALRQLTAAFHTNLTALGLIALLVGMFLIANTASFAVVRRRELFARLRAHGATPGQLATLVLGEACIAGLCAAVLGLALGVALAQVLVGLVTRTIGDLYANIGHAAIGNEPLVLVQGLLLGVGATLLATAWPAWDAARSTPRLGLLRTGSERAWQCALPWIAAAGATLLAACAATLAWAPATIPAGFAAIGLGVLGAAVLVPALVVPLVRLLALPARRQPLVALAARAVDANLSRTGIAVAALSVACAAALGMALMVSSFRRALDEWLSATLSADVYLSAPRLVAARVGDAPLDPVLVTQLLAVQGIAAVVPKRDSVIGSDHGELALVAFDPLPTSRLSFVARPAFGSTGERDAAWDAFARGAVFVTEPFANRRALTTGDQLVLRSPTGDHPVRIAAVLADYSSDQGCVYLDRGIYRAWYHDDAITALAITASPEVGAATLVSRLRETAGDAPLYLTPGATLKAASLTVFDRTFAITSVIRWMATGVAVLGLIAALAAVQLERARSTARLRAIGLTPGGVLGLALAECLLTGLAAGLLALPIGIGLAAGLTHVINRRSFGWSMELHLDPWQLLLTVTLAAGAAVLAGIIPAWRAGRRNLVEALHAE